MKDSTVDHHDENKIFKVRHPSENFDINPNAPSQNFKKLRNTQENTFLATKCTATWNGLSRWPTFNARFVDKNLSFCRNHLIIFVCSQSLSSPPSFIEVNGITNLSLKERADNGNRSIQFGAWLNVFESLSAFNGHFFHDSIFDQD